MKIALPTAAAVAIAISSVTFTINYTSGQSAIPSIQITFKAEGEDSKPSNTAQTQQKPTANSTCSAGLRVPQM